MKPDPALSLIVTCHPPYLRFLPEALASIARQTAPALQIILALDHCPPDWIQVAGIRHREIRADILQGDWHNPGAARAAALQIANADWLVHWDADNIMPPGYLQHVIRSLQKTSPDTAVLYPYMSIDGRRLGRNHGADPRENYYVDTCSAWRKTAILSAGNWRTDLRRLDDWDLAARIHRQGWKFAPLRIEIPQRADHDRRSTQTPEPDAVWDARDIGIVSLQRGCPDLFARFLQILDRIQLPPRAGLTLLDNSGSAAFAKNIRGKLSRLAARFQRLTILSAPPLAAPDPTFHQIHCHVAHLYGLAIPATPETAILTWEDDVFPAKPDAIRLLSAAMLPGRQIAAVAAIYPSRSQPEFAVASLETTAPNWRRQPPIASLQARPTEAPVPAGAVGGGFTLWSRPALQRIPLRSSRPTPQLGWDGDLCARLREAAYHIRLHPGVFADHCPP